MTPKRADQLIDGILAKRSDIPSQRALADHLGLHRNTISSWRISGGPRVYEMALLAVYHSLDDPPKPAK